MPRALRAVSSPTIVASSPSSPSHSSLFERAIAQTRDYALFLLDPKGHIMTWNTGAERLKGYAPDEIIGRHFSTFYTADSVASGWPAHELRVASMEGRFEDEGWRVRKDGSRFWANVVITALRGEDGQLLCFSKITRDITSRKLQEEALAQSEERFRLLVEGVLDYAIYMLDPEGVVVSWNSGATRIKGYAASDIIGQHFSRFFTPDDIEAGQPWAELEQARSVGRSEVEGWRVKKNGDRFWARAVVSALHDAHGRLRGYAKVTQDLSQRRQVQALEQAAQNVNEFIAILAHELRNPLAPIRTALSVLDRKEVPAANRDAMLGIISRQAHQLSRIVDDMLDISRVTRGEFDIERAQVNLNEVVRLAVETAQPAIDDNNHRLELVLCEEPPIILGDQRRLTQIVTNLLNNAARYTAPGGSITISTGRSQETAWLKVRDSG